MEKLTGHPQTTCWAIIADLFLDRITEAEFRAVMLPGDHDKPTAIGHFKKSLATNAKSTEYHLAQAELKTVKH